MAATTKVSYRRFFFRIRLVIIPLVGTLLLRSLAKTSAQPSPAQVDIGQLKIFPTDNAWNLDISKQPTDENSTQILSRIGLKKPLHPDFGARYQGRTFGIPYVVVPGNQPKVRVAFEYANESDPGPYPIPPDAPIEGPPGASDGDRHVLVIDADHKKLYELFAAVKKNGGWSAGSGAIFDLTSNALRPAGWTSADAAGLPIFPGLVRYDEAVEKKAIQHALRFTVVHLRHAYIAPATHFAAKSNDADLPPMGMRVRLKPSFDITKYPSQARVILQALKTYGMILADNGSDWFLSGAPDSRWDDQDLGTLKRVKVSDFEVIKMGTMTTR